MKKIEDLADEAADAFGIREKHKKRFAVVLDVLQAFVCFWRWFKDKDEKRDED